MSDFESNPHLYRELSAPFSTEKELGDAFQKFLDEAHKLRVELGIADVVFCLKANAITGDGEKPFITVAGYGNLAERPVLLQWALEYSKREIDEIIKKDSRKEKRTKKAKATR